MPFQHGGHITKDLFGNLASVVAGRVRWLMLDRFLTDRAVGAVNGTDAEPGPGTRQTTEASGATISIVGGRAKLIGSGSSYVHLKLNYNTAGINLTKARGKMAMIDWTAPSAGFGRGNFFANPAFLPNGLWFQPRASNTLALLGALNAQQVYATLTAGQTYEAAFIMRNPGAFLMLDGKLLFVDSAFVGNYDFSDLFQVYDTGPFYLDNLRLVMIPSTNLSLYPTPKLSDTFDTPVIVDYGDLGLNVVPTNVTLDGTAGKYNGVSSYIKTYNAGLVSLFDVTKGTVIVRGKKAVTPWISGYHELCEIFTDNNNRVLFTAYNTDLQISYIAGGTTKGKTKTSMSGTSWMTVGLTFDKAADQCQAYFDGTGEGVTTGLGTWVGTVGAASIGVYANGYSSSFWDGSIGDVIIANTVASDAQMSTIHTALAAGTLTKATLDGIFGSGHYVWYKQNETYQSNGLAHVETASVTAVDSSVNAFNGTHVNVKVEGGAGTYNGTSSYTNIYSAGLNTWFSGSTGTAYIRMKVNSPGVWADATIRASGYVAVDSNNYVSIFKSSTTGVFTFQYRSGGTTSQVQVGGQSTDDYFGYGGTWDKPNDEVKGFLNGAQTGATVNGLGVWAGNLSSTLCTLGAGSTTPGFPWSGDISDAVYAKTTATPAQMATLHTALAAGTLTSTTLDTIFGAGNWLWYKYDEAVTYSGEDLTWAQSGLAWNNAQKTYIQPTPGADIAVDGNMEAAGVGAFTPSHAVLTKEVAAPHSGTQSLRVTMDGTATYGRGNQFYLTAGEIYRMTGWYHGDGVTNYPLIAHGVGTSFVTGGTSAAWASYAGTFRALGNQLCFQANSGSSSGYSEFDDTFIYPITFADCLRYIDPSVGELLISAKLTVTDLNMAGFVINLDSGTSPQNCVHVFVDRRNTLNRVIARNMVSGVWSADDLFASVTYSAGTYLEVRRIGTSCYVWYNNVYVGNWTTAVPSTNTKIALFASDSASYFENVTVFPTTGYNYGAYA